MGREDFKNQAVYSLNLAHYLYDQLKGVKGVSLPYQDNFFNEFVWKVDQARDVLDKLFAKGIIAGFYLGDLYPQSHKSILSFCSEKKSKEEIDSFVDALKETLGE